MCGIGCTLTQVWYTLYQKEKRRRRMFGKEEVVSLAEIKSPAPPPPLSFPPLAHSAQCLR